MTAAPTEPLVTLARTLRSFALVQVVASAVRRDLPTYLAEGPQPVAALAARTGLRTDRLEAVMAVLVELGIAARDADGGYAPTELTPLLVRDTGRLHGQALMSADMYYKVWAALDHTLDTGESAFPPVFGTTMWGYLEDHPEVGEQFSRTMGAGSALAVEPFLKAVDVPAEGTVADLGAGDGTLVAALLEHHPGLRAQVVELPAQARRVERALAERGLAERCEVIAGDMFTTVPPGADLYVLKGVLHNWPDADAARLLAAVHAAAAPGARLAVVERTLAPSGPMTVNQAVNTLTMALLFGAAERTADQYAALVAGAGFRTRTLDAGDAGFDVVEGLRE